MNDGQLAHPEPDPVPFKVHLLTRAGRAMRAHTEPVRAFSTKDEAIRFAGRQLGGNYAVYHKDRKIWPISHDAPRWSCAFCEAPARRTDSVEIGLIGHAKWAGQILQHRRAAAAKKAKKASRPRTAAKRKRKIGAAFAAWPAALRRPASPAMLAQRPTLKLTFHPNHSAGADHFK